MQATATYRDQRDSRLGDDVELAGKPDPQELRLYHDPERDAITVPIIHGY